MKVIGITGGIGSGKSRVLDILSDRYSAYVVEADKVAKKLMLPGNEVYNKVVRCFGRDILSADNHEIDAKKLGSLVMNDTASLEKLNSIVHPAVKEYILRDIKAQRDNGVDYYIIEAALLIQDNYTEICDEIWAVITDKETRISRLMSDRGYSRKKAEDFIKNQPDELFYKNGSNRIIMNNGTIFDLIKSVDDLFQL
ncbi:MAG: dephospho-CoA kinase [Eubacterium sp.]|nr:dephospho-CoA kinase [Eubacterium sp.]